MAPKTIGPARFRALALLVLVAPAAISTPAAAQDEESEGEQEAQLTSFASIGLDSLSEATIETLLVYAFTLTSQVREGADLNDDGKVDETERRSFEDFVNARESVRPVWTWNLTMDGIAFERPEFANFTAPNIEGPTDEEERVVLSSTTSVNLTGALVAGASHELRFAPDPAAPDDARPFAGVEVLAPGTHVFAAPPGAGDDFDLCLAEVAEPPVDLEWSLTLEEGTACTEAAIEERANELEEAFTAPTTPTTPTGPTTPTTPTSPTNPTTPATKDKEAPGDDDTPAAGIAVTIGLLAALGVLAARRRGG